MARLNVWVPDELAARARAEGLNVSALTQAALQAELDRHATDQWLSGLALPDEPSVDPAVALAALDAAREDFGDAAP